MKRLIRAAKQVGIVYHTTTISNLHDILTSGKLYVSSETGAISFTRDKSFRITADANAILQFNGDKLSERYVMIPVADGDGFSIVDKDTITDRALISQYETRLVTKEAKRLRQLRDALEIAEHPGNDYERIASEMLDIIQTFIDKKIYLDLKTYSIDEVFIDWVGPKNVYKRGGLLNVDSIGGFSQLVRARSAAKDTISVIDFVEGCNHWFREYVRCFKVVDTRVVHPRYPTIYEGMKNTTE